MSNDRTNAALSGRGAAGDPAALDEVELRLWRDIFDSPVEDAIAEQGIEVVRFGPVHAFVVDSAADDRTMNRVLGAAAPGAVEHGHLDSALEWAQARGVDHSVPVTPGLADAGAAEDWLNRQGYERSHGLVRFVRDTSLPGFRPPPALEVIEYLCSDEGGEGFSSLVAKGFENRELLGGFYFSLMDNDEWRCYAVIDEYEWAVACGAMRIHEGIAQLGIAATHPLLRGRGCHLALLHRRIRDAAEAGCHTLFADVHEPLDGLPSTARRNLLRAGFEEAYVRPNWESPPLAEDEEDL
jgi:GNAT superfamily N-acetyltransferase